MTRPWKKSKPEKPEEPVSPLEAEMAEAAAIPQETPPPTEDEVASASIFTEETPPAAEPAAAAAIPPEAAAELETLRAQASEYLDGWQRARAEFANYKKRIERDQDEARARATAAVITKVLPVADDLERALRERPENGDARAWSDGVELIYRKLTALLEAEGVESIPAAGEIFDPALHEAVTYETSADHDEGRIIEVIQQGYRLGDRVLRPARVRVAR